MEERYYEIDRYLAGEMNQEEKAAFQRKMETDETLREQVDLYRFAQQKLQPETADEKALRKTLSSISTRTPSPSSNTITRKRILLLAASFLLILSLILYWLFPPAKPEVNIFYQYPLAHFSERGDQETPLYQAERMFNRKNYGAAKDHFENHLNSDPADIQAQLYLGICYLETNAFDQAISTFEKVGESSVLLLDRVNWYLGLTYYKKGDREKALEYLSKITELSDLHARATTFSNFIQNKE